jgi:hypothetical protein
MFASRNVRLRRLRPRVTSPRRGEALAYVHFDNEPGGDRPALVRFVAVILFLEHFDAACRAA